MEMQSELDEDNIIETSSSTSHTILKNQYIRQDLEHKYSRYKILLGIEERKIISLPTEVNQVMHS